MKHYRLLFIVLVSMVFLASCESEEVKLKTNNEREIVLGVSFANEQTRASMSLIDGSLNMDIRWQEGDVVNIVILQDGVYQSAGQSEVYDIAENGKTCNMRVTLPSDVDNNKMYTIMCMTEVGMSVVGQKLHCATNLSRTPMKDFKVRMYAAKNMEPDGERVVQFRHFGTYEVLHVVNSTDKAVSFNHCGFSASKKWYYTIVDYVFNISEYDLENKNTNSDSESTEITIPARSSVSFVSWYMPTGEKLQNANLIAKIDGKKVESKNTLSSQATISLGKAYHMYAEWDGKDLRFVKDVDVVDYNFELDDMPGEDINEPLNYDKSLCPDGHHPHMIDLGLPSGTLWSCCNVGASKPEDYGDFYAWGETKIFSNTNQHHYDHYKDGQFVYIGDDISGTQYDVAHVNWGVPWMIPSKEKFEELIMNCTLVETQINGIIGNKFTGKNGNSVFIPLVPWTPNPACTIYWTSTYSLEKKAAVSCFMIRTEFAGSNPFISIYYDENIDIGGNIRPVCNNEWSEHLPDNSPD